MYKLSEQVERKFEEVFDIDDYEILTDSGWEDISSIQKTIPYKTYELETENGLYLKCADDHIVFDKNMDEIFTKNLKINDEIVTIDGNSKIKKIYDTNQYENMYDITVNSDNHRYYTNGILSHNTSITQAIFYVLYGDALTKIKKDNLINKDNGKNMMVSLTFTVKNIKYRIERGRKPNILSLYINDTEMNFDKSDDEAQGENKETQKEINKIINISPDLFKQTIILNTKNTPFLSMRDKEQRAIIEELLGIDILSKKAEKLKEEIKIIKDDIKEEEIRLQSIKQINEKITNQINELKYKSKRWMEKHQKDIDEMESTINDLNHINVEEEINNHKLLAEYNDLKLKIKDTSRQVNDIDIDITNNEKLLKKYQKQKDQIKESICPTCNQEIHDDHSFIEKDIDNNIVEVLQKIEELNKLLSTPESELKELELKIKGMTKPSIFYDDINEAYEHKNTIQLANNELSNLKNKENPFLEQIENLNISGIQKIDYEYLEDLSLVKEHQEFLYKMLTNKESPIRKKIIDQNISMLNTSLEEYINVMKLPHTVKFNNDLSVSINNLGNEFDFDQLSNGEQNRVILSLSWAFRDVYEYLNNSINLSIIDELIDSGMDSLGTDSSLKVLKTMVREQNKSIFLISHKDGLESRVDNVLNVVKEDGFTTYFDEQDEI